MPKQSKLANLALVAKGPLPLSVGLINSVAPLTDFQTCEEPQLAGVRSRALNGPENSNPT